MPAGSTRLARTASPEPAREEPSGIAPAGRVAHDFNNALQVISGNLELAMRLLAHASIGDERVRAQIVAAIERAQRSTEKLATDFQRTIVGG